jgi:hypothetical protein
MTLSGFSMMEPAHDLPGRQEHQILCYYRCSNHMKAAYDRCSTYRHYRAAELEEHV